MHKPAQVELQLDRPQLSYSEILGLIITRGSPAHYHRRQLNLTKKGPTMVNITFFFSIVHTCKILRWLEINNYLVYKIFDQWTNNIQLIRNSAYMLRTIKFVIQWHDFEYIKPIKIIKWCNIIKKLHLYMREINSLNKNF